MVEVKKKYPEETIESLIRRFNRKVLSSGIITDLKKNEYYIKPSLKKHRKI